MVLIWPILSRIRSESENSQILWFLSNIQFSYVASVREKMIKIDEKKVKNVIFLNLEQN